MKKIALATCIAVVFCMGCVSPESSTIVSVEEQSLQAMSYAQSSESQAHSSKISSSTASSLVSSAPEDFPLVADEWSPPDDVVASLSASLKAEAQKNEGTVLDIFHVTVLDKNDLPVNNAMVSTSSEIGVDEFLTWQTNMHGSAIVNHMYSGIGTGHRFEYNGEYEVTVTVRMPKSIGDISQTYKVVTTKEAVDAGIVFKMEHYDSTVKIDETTPRLAVTVVDANQQPLSNIRVTVRPKSTPLHPDGRYNNEVVGFTDKQGEVSLYNLADDEYIIEFTNNGAISGIDTAYIVYDSAVVNEVHAQKNNS